MWMLWCVSRSEVLPRYVASGGEEPNLEKEVRRKVPLKRTPRGSGARNSLVKEKTYAYINPESG